MDVIALFLLIDISLRGGLGIPDKLLPEATGEPPNDPIAVANNHKLFLGAGQSHLKDATEETEGSLNNRMKETEHGQQQRLYPQISQIPQIGGRQEGGAPSEPKSDQWMKHQ